MMSSMCAILSCFVNSSIWSSWKTLDFGGFLGVLIVYKMAVGGRLITFWETGTIVGTGFNIGFSLIRVGVSTVTSSAKCLWQNNKDILQCCGILSVQKLYPFNFLFFILRQGKNRSFIVSSIVGKQPMIEHLYPMAVDFFSRKYDDNSRYLELSMSPHVCCLGMHDTHSYLNVLI